MEAKVIKTKAQYDRAVSEMKRLMSIDPDPSTHDGDRLELLAFLIDAFEKEHFPVPNPTPIEAINFRMEEGGLKQRDIAPYIGSKSKVSEILSGKRPLTLDMIRALNENLGIPLHVLTQKQEEDCESLDDVDWSKFPIKEMVKRGWINAAAEDLKNKSTELIKSFFSQIGDSRLETALCRRTLHGRTTVTYDEFGVKAWLAQVLIRTKRKGSSNKYKAGTVNDSFMKEVAQLSCSNRGPLLAQEFLFENGISLIIESHLPGTKLDGAALFTEDDRPVIGMTLRHDRLDNFWFTLMHELAHIKLHFKEDNNENIFVDDLEVHEGADQKEKDADRLAKEILVPSSRLHSSAAFHYRNQQSVNELARELNIHPSIVAGRIRFEQRNFKILSAMLGNNCVRNLFNRS